MNLAIPANLRLAVYGSGAHDAAWRSTLAFEGMSATVLTCAAAQPLAALRELAAAHPDVDLLLIEAGSVLPEAWLPRLLRCAGSTRAQVISPLGNAEPELSPLVRGSAATAMTPAAVDRGCFLYAPRLLAESARWLRSCALWRRTALDWLLDHSDYDTDILPPAIDGVICDHLFVADPQRPFRGPALTADARFPAPASPLDILRARYTEVAGELPTQPGLDGRPVVLHILHGWGGGAEVFVRDLARADHEQCHLILIARGHGPRDAHGEVLDLTLAGVDAPALRQYPLPRGIAATVLGSTAYRAAMTEVLRDFAVDAVMVSSLIGHSLDALATGRPTTVVCHDYFPLWPLLHCDFGDPLRRWDAVELARDLRTQDASPFAQRDPTFWQALREAYVRTLLSVRPTLVTPTESVRRNLLRLEPRLSALPATVIAHGLRPFPTTVTASEAPLHPRLRVLILGRIAGGKGLALLTHVIPRITDFADVYLLGCGKEGEAFFGISHVHVVLDYARDELPQASARIAPDLALLPTTVAETFSYTLSELWALGVPPLASALGSFVERIDDGRNGLLVAPDVDTIVERLRALHANREPLQAIRAQLRTQVQRDSAIMAQDYRRLMALPAHGSVRYGLADVAPADLALGDALDTTLQQRAALTRAKHELAHQALELDERAAWANRMERQFRERAAWAEELRAEVDRVHGQHIQLTRDFEERSDWALSLDRERATMLGSLSWRVTRPLRAAGRLSRSARARVAFRLARVLGLLRRVRISLRMRGPMATVRHAIVKILRLRSGLPPTVAHDLSDSDAPFAPFALPTSDSPRVSIVIPVYNQFRHTLGCLRSLARHPSVAEFEVIVVDDCSSDETAAQLPQIDGLRAQRNAQNLGFIGACNAGAANARGEFLVFLNNDTAVTPGWLDALVRTFDTIPQCGLAGAKLVYPDGRLQEAGGIVFADASGWNYGRFGNPADPAYNYVREVDYCSGAAIMIRRELFARFGGFDTRYAPAYYEDTDLAFRVREAGLRAIYQPVATVVHFEGITSGTDTSSGTKRYQVINQGKFAERWKDALARQPKPGMPIAIAREHRVRGRVLIIDACTPMPDKDSGSVRMINLMRLLIDLGWKVSFFSENRLYDNGYTEALQQLGVEALYHPWIADPLDWFREHGAVLDAVILSRHYVASAYVPLVREYARNARVIFDTVDLHYLREERAAALEARADLAKLAHATKAQELKLVRSADVTLVVSPVEQQLLRMECPGARIEVLSNVHEVRGSRRAFAQRRDIFFIGGFQHPPNLDAVHWFVREIWPLVAVALPDVVFHIVGSDMPEEIASLGSERVRATGYVETLDEYLDGCRLSVAPLRYGAGVKGKVNQSMAHGQAVIATTIAVEGMHVIAGEDVLVADTPDAFAAAVVRAYQDEALWNQLSRNGLKNVQQHFSFDAARTALAQILPRTKSPL